MKTQTEQMKPKSPRRSAPVPPTELSEADLEKVAGGFLNPNMTVPDLRSIADYQPWA